MCEAKRAEEKNDLGVRREPKATDEPRIPRYIDSQARGRIAQPGGQPATLAGRRL
jgi:hypothetical protein